MGAQLQHMLISGLNDDQFLDALVHWLLAADIVEGGQCIRSTTPDGAPAAAQSLADVSRPDFARHFLGVIGHEADAVSNAAEATLEAEALQALASSDTAVPGATDKSRPQQADEERHDQRQGQPKDAAPCFEDSFPPLGASTNKRKKVGACRGRAAWESCLLALVLINSEHACMHGLQGGPQVPVGVLMRIVSHAPLQLADKTGSKGGSGSSRRRLAPTPVAQVTRDERFNKQPGPQQQPHARRRLAPSPVTSLPASSGASSGAVTLSAQTEQGSQGSRTDTCNPQHRDGNSVPHRVSWATVTASPVGNSGSLAHEGSSIRGSEPSAGGTRKSAEATPDSKQRRADALSMRFGDLDMSAKGESPQLTPSSSRQQGSMGASVTCTRGTPTSNGGSVADNQRLCLHGAETPSAALQSQACSNALPSTGPSQGLPSTPGSGASISSRPPSADCSSQQRHQLNAVRSPVREPAEAEQGAAAAKATAPLDTVEPHEQPPPQMPVPGKGPEAGAGASQHCTSEQWRRAVTLHAAVLTGPDLAPLGQQLEMLLHLLALPPAVHVGGAVTGSYLGAAGQRLFPSSCAASAYACGVLQGSGAWFGPGCTVGVVKPFMPCAAPELRGLSAVFSAGLAIHTP